MLMKMIGPALSHIIGGLLLDYRARPKMMDEPNMKIRHYLFTIEIEQPNNGRA